MCSLQMSLGSCSMPADCHHQERLLMYQWGCKTLRARNRPTGYSSSADEWQGGCVKQLL